MIEKIEDKRVGDGAVEQLVEFEKVLKYALIAVAGIFVAVFIPMAIARSVYPYDLEWMEGGMVDHALRILDGGQLYVEPKLDFIPFTYTPLYFYVSAAFSAVFGEGHFSLRLISILATLGCFYVIFRLVRIETGEWLYGLLSAGLFAAGFVIVGSWYDLARADMLFIFLVLVGVYLLRQSDKPLFLVLAGLLFWLSFMTKQTALIVAAAMSVYCLIYLPGWRKAVFPATVFGLAGLSTLVINKLSDGWYIYYIYHLPQQKDSIPGQIEGFWTTNMRPLYLGIAVTLAFLFYLIVTARRKDFAFYTMLFTGTVGASWLISNYQGSYLNDLIPALAGISVLFGLGIAALISAGASKMPDDEVTGSRDFSRLLLVNFVLIAGLMQFLVLIYNPFNQFPSSEDKMAGDRLVTLLEQAEGGVFMPAVGYLPRKAGKTAGAHVVALGDVMNANEQESERLENEYAESLENNRYDLVLLDSDFGHDWIIWDEAESEARQYDTLVGKVFFDKEDFIPVTGANERPDVLFIFTRRWDWDSVYRALGFVDGNPPVEVDQD